MKDEDNVDETADGSWNEGGVVSGSVVKQIPVETPALHSVALKYTLAPADIRPFNLPSIASSSSTHFCQEPVNADCCALVASSGDGASFPKLWSNR